MYKIIYTTAEDFVKQEIKEYGYDYVEAQFAMGYEPTLDRGGFYVWAASDSNNVSCCSVPSSRYNTVSNMLTGAWLK